MVELHSESAPLYHVPGWKFKRGVLVTHYSHLGEGDTQEAAIADAEARAREIVEKGMAEGRWCMFSLGAAKAEQLVNNSVTPSLNNNAQ